MAGCALGFVTPGQPPHVLRVDPDTETAKQGIQSYDLLLSIDGQDISQFDQDKVAALLRTAKSLVFERPAGGDEDAGQARAAEDPRPRRRTSKEMQFLQEALTADVRP